ncbi:ERCC4 domain-containing protein [Thermodesulfobacteriota bacterium]
MAIERKSVDDLVGCLKGSGRERFERELRRSRSMDYFALVVEGSLSGLAKGHYQSHIAPASVVQSIMALSIRYRIPVWFAESRKMGQRITESLLEKYARDVCKRFAALQGVTEKSEAA